MISRATLLGAALLAMACTACNTFSDLEEAAPGTNNATSNTNNATNNTNNASNGSNNATNNTNNATNNTNNTTNGSNNATNGSNNATNNATNNTTGGPVRLVTINCDREAPVSSNYVPLTSDYGGFNGTNCVAADPRRFSFGVKDVTHPAQNLSLVTTGDGFRGVWSSDSGIQTIESGGKVESLTLGSVGPNATEVVLIPTAENLFSLAHLDANLCGLAIDMTPEAADLGTRQLTVDDCPADPHGLTYAGGYNPFHPSGSHESHLVLFSGSNSITYDIGEDAIGQNATGTLPNLLVLPNPYIEPTSGRFIGFLDQAQDFHLRGVLSDQAPLPLLDQREPGTVALVHLANEHYALASIEQDHVSITLIQAGIDDGTAEIWTETGAIWNVPTGSNVRYLDMAVVDGGLVLFVDQDGSWTMIPIRVRTSSTDGETLDCQVALRYEYPASIDYNDVDMAVSKVGNCGIRAAVLTSFNIGNPSYVHLEGADFPNFYFSP
ncbi:MAG: hypothetical protein R3E66_18910 [bacterium]